MIRRYSLRVIAFILPAGSAAGNGIKQAETLVF